MHITRILRHNCNKSLCRDMLTSTHVFIDQIGYELGYHLLNERKKVLLEAVYFPAWLSAVFFVAWLFWVAI
ncbi:hypothetical protein BDN72DRAFT_832881 [Pluteus cervinus]|uniref:Uncharacterized protein n=1 Tax=Pluteus cervinus TaxID=181527 RepID=A0ACD3B9R9_9AGAR|nr:hypothetical protein BDN72DRAFT_832881 [Pluteus cervinus]